MSLNGSKKVRNKFCTASSEETEQLGEALAEEVEKGQVIAFFGDLGSGKTTLIKGLASKLAGAGREEVSSPTFVYLHIYQGVQTVFHFDLYRLKQEQDFIDMGFFEYLETDGICLIEWPERIASLLPKGCWKVWLAYEGEKRLVTIEK